MRITTGVLLVALVAAAGCKSSNKAGEDGGQTTATEPGQPGAPMPTPTPGAAVPADFPKVVPIYPGATVIAATKVPGPTGKGAWTVGLVSKDDKNIVYTYFRANMSAFKQATDNTVGPARTGTWQNPQYDVTVTVGDSPDKHTSVAMTVNAK
ncbi:MAG TPA: hypothetical protein VMI75_39710 [Polyangiaceae bacterium]|nr:hypothetical protein [Polyangiaceae bacterium]